MGCESCSGGSCDRDKTGLPPGMLSEYNLNQSPAEGSLVWIEVINDGNTIMMNDSSKEILGKLQEISDGRIFGVIFGDTELKVLYGEIFSYGVDTLYHIKDKKMIQFQPEVYCEMLVDLCNRVMPAVVLMGATPRGRELAPRLAASLGTGLTADCTELKMDGRFLQMTRPAFGGNIIATISCDHFPQMATVRPGTFPMPEPMIGREGTVIYRQYYGSNYKNIISSERIISVDYDITRAKILISLGNGIKEKESVAVAESIAKKLGGMVSCSRALVERGWFPQSRQVGQSGNNVFPDIYMAFGISGSIQHKAGIGSAKRVIAVNIDPEAPIHEIADVSVIGNADSILKEMNKLL